jgi:hypothetical protein
MHYNRRGKVLNTKHVVPEISKITAKMEVVPISLGWLTDTEQVDSISLVNPVEVMESNEEFMDESRELVDSRTVASQNNETTCPTLTKTVINEPTSGVEIFDSSDNSTKSKRLRKTPCKRSKDLLW